MALKNPKESDSEQNAGLVSCLGYQINFFQQLTDSLYFYIPAQSVHCKIIYGSPYLKEKNALWQFFEP